MKKIFLSSLMLLSMALVFTACEEDRDSNPTLVQPTSFTLNNPVNTLVDLELSKGIPFAWSQPDFGGWPAACEYQLEVSPTNEWTVSTADADADTTGAVVANYATIKTVYAGCSGDMLAEELNKALNKILMWEEGNVPEKQTVYVRCSAVTAGALKVYSNVVSLDVNPYYVDLSAEVSEEVEIWYLVGAGIGSADWDNGGEGSIATGGLIPMYPVFDTDDSSIMPGEIQYVGYFTADMQFKLIRDPGDWGNQWGMGDAGYVKNDGGSGNLTVPSDGYYKIHLNTAADELTIEPYEGTVGVYAQIAMPGNYQGWDTGADFMNPMSTSVENHDWYLKSVTYEETTLKFAADNSWDVNWGGKTFPYGLGTQGGPDIAVPAGTYHVYFNDILGTYNFVPVE
ncbi:MAG: SusF/SusE family outer membrane protein [Muribaculaceae bacterium]|nr:SusF/SusE family outer membrane protein [Muribaculaceae bacterium]